MLGMPRQPYTEKCLELLPSMGLELRQGSGVSDPTPGDVPYVCLLDSPHTGEREMVAIKRTFQSSEELVAADPSLGPATGCMDCFAQQKHRQRVSWLEEELRKMSLTLKLDPKGPAPTAKIVPYVCLLDSSHTDDAPSRKMKDIENTFQSSEELVAADPSLGPATGCMLCLEQQKHQQLVSRFLVYGWEYVTRVDSKTHKVVCLGCGVDDEQRVDSAKDSLRAFNKNIDELRAKYEVPFPVAMQSRKGGCPACTLTARALVELSVGFNLEPADPQSFTYQPVGKGKDVTTIELDLKCCLCSSPVSATMANLRNGRSTWRTADGKRTGCENCYPRYNAMPNSVTWQQVQEEVTSKYDRKFTGKLRRQFKPDEVVSVETKFKSVHNVCGKVIKDTLRDLRSRFSPDSAYCSHCAKSGYDPSKDGWLYVIWHPELQVWKIGISNNPEKRLSDHKTSGFDVGDSAALIGPKEGYNGSEIASLEKELLAIAASEGAVSLKETGQSNLSRRGYTESWTAASFTPAHVGFGDTQALLDWLMDEYHRGLEQFAA